MAYRSSTEQRLERFFLSLFGFLMLVALNFLNAWFVMLGLDVANDYWPQVPAMGYWGTFLLLCGIGAVAGTIHGGMRMGHKED